MANRMKWITVSAAIAAAGFPAVAGATKGTPITAPAPESHPDLKVLQAALASLDGQVTHRMSVDGTVGVTFKQPKSRMSVSMSDDFTAIVQVGSPTRASMSLVDGAIGPMLSAVSYDGVGYAGTMFDPYVRLSGRDSAFVAGWFEPKRQQLRPNDLRYLSDVRLIPTSGADAKLVHFRAVLSPDYTRSVVRALTLDTSKPNGGSLATSLDYTPGTIDVFVGSDGRLVRESVAVSATLRPGQSGPVSNFFNRRVGSGSLAMSATFTPTDMGDQVAINKPYIPKQDPGMMEDYTALVLLMGAGSAADTYANVTGSYAGLDLAALRRIEPEIVWVKRRPARSARFEVRLQSVQPKEVVMSTRTPSLREFIMKQPLSGDVKVSCRTRKGKACQISIFAKIVGRISGHTNAATARRLVRGR